MRGKGARDTTIFQCCRITPAYAGKRFYRFSGVIISKDHPRLCGEKSQYILHARSIFGSPVQGSPPPMRGKGCMQAIAKLIPGITPAYAGKSCFYLDAVAES